jgi:sulfite exporter TauE/SafE
MFDALTAQVGAAFLLALLGGAHCAGMCGGFVGAIQLRRAPQVSAGALRVGYHAGRITSYTTAGLVAGALGGAAYASDVLPLQVLLLVAGSLMLVAVGASMLGQRRWLARLEPLGRSLWRALSPHARRIYPPSSRGQAYAAGLLWGWIPCGMVYAALPLALTAGSTLGGAAVMAGFGIGTLPTMLALDVTAAKLAHPAKHGSPVTLARLPVAWFKVAAGLTIVVFGVSGLAHAARVSGAQHPAIAAVASICHR